MIDKWLKLADENGFVGGFDSEGLKSESPILNTVQQKVAGRKTVVTTVRVFMISLSRFELYANRATASACLELSEACTKLVSALFHSECHLDIFFGDGLHPFGHSAIVIPITWCGMRLNLSGEMRADEDGHIRFKNRSISELWVSMHFMSSRPNSVAQ